MGAWGNGRFDNDSALDFVDSLKKSGVAALRQALEQDIVRNLEHVQKYGSVAAIEAVIAARLEKHRAHLAAGLNVGSEAALESELREVLMAGLTEPSLSAALPFAAALEVLAAACGYDADLGKDGVVSRWVSRNRSKVIGDLGKLIAAAQKGQALINQNRDLSDRSLDFLDDRPAWYARVDEVIALLSNKNSEQKPA